MIHNPSVVFSPYPPLKSISFPSSLLSASLVNQTICPDDVKQAPPPILLSVIGYVYMLPECINHISPLVL